jgi:hypothetical protein
MKANYAELLANTKLLVNARIEHINAIHPNGPSGSAWLEITLPRHPFIKFLKQNAIGVPDGTRYLVGSHDFVRTDNAFVAKDVCEIVREVWHEAGIEAVTRVEVRK